LEGASVIFLESFKEVAFADFTSDQGLSLSEIGEMLKKIRHVRGFDIAKNLHDFVIQNIDETGLTRTKTIPSRDSSMR
jgi:hypothetical protein